MRPLLLLAALLFATFPVVADAQWSSDPATNFVVADGSGDQVQPKIAPTADGGAWISWYDAIGNGFDVRVQKVDSGGNELLAHNGVLVADRGFSSTQDYGLDVDASGNALLAFRDDSGSGIQITAAKVTPAGVLAWGASGVQLTSTNDFIAAPKIAGTSDGGTVVAWTQEATTRIQKLDASGAPLWLSDVVLTPVAGSYSASDLHDAGTDAILSFVHQTGAFLSPRHLYVNKLDADGALLWSAAHVAVFDGGSLQIANFPTFVPDGSGGAVLSWYDTAAPQLQSSAQHILANGTEAFPHNGSVASTNATRGRVSPAVAFDAATSETYLFFVEQSSNQAQRGVYAQKFDPSGARQWTDDGIQVVPVGSNDVSQVRTLFSASGSFVFWAESLGFNQDFNLGARLDAAGAIDIEPFYFASTSSGKSRLAAAQSTSGFAILAWQDNRNDEEDEDVFVQNVNGDGTLGAPAIDVPVLTDATGMYLAVSPNPTRGVVRLEYSLPANQTATLDIFDVQGRTVRSAFAVIGNHGTVTWDRHDDGGAPVAAGVYFVRLRSESTQQTKSVTVLD